MASIRYGGGKAFYTPTGDYIQVPPKATFESLDEYYATSFHECATGTEHPTRLDWSRKERENTYALGNSRRNRVVLLLPGTGRPGIRD